MRINVKPGVLKAGTGNTEVSVDNAKWKQEKTHAKPRAGR